MTNKYIQVKVHVSEGQKDNIARAIQAGTGVSIKLSHSDLTGEHIIAVTHAQANRLAKAYQNNSGMILKLSKTQLKYNKGIEGGFLGAILPMLATAAKFILPALATGALTGVGAAAGSKIVDKISGSGVAPVGGSSIVYLKKGGQCYKIMTQGNGLYLRNYPKGVSLGEGMYLRNGGSYESVGRGIIFGENSPIQNKPVLGQLLGWLL